MVWLNYYSSDPNHFVVCFPRFSALAGEDNMSEQKHLGDFDDQVPRSTSPEIQDELRTLILNKKAKNKQVIKWIDVSETSYKLSM